MMGKNLIFACILLFSSHFLNAQKFWDHGRLIISSNGHYLQFQDGTAFFWLGDTGWELFHRLKLEEINSYFENRSKKGFNVIQAVVLAEMDGLTRPNQYGDVPFIGLDPLKPNERYFHFVDSVIILAATKNLYIGLLPSWGDKVTKLWGAGPVVFNEDNAYKYGSWLGNRYKNSPNIIWILGGDRPAKKDSLDWTPIWRAMARGILDATEQHALITYHPWGGNNSTSQYIHNETWLNINMMQSGHGSGHDVPVWEWVERDRNLKPTKPCLDAEPNYEDHPVNPWPNWNPANGYFREYDVRKQTYRSVFAGACGVTYGHHSVWQFWSPREEIINHADRYWTDAIDRPGAFQVGFLRKLMESRPQLTRVPDQTIIVNGQGTHGEYISACRDSIGSYLMIYLPVGKSIKINTHVLHSDSVSANWFNPRDAMNYHAGTLKRENLMNFTPPISGLNFDWVLILDDPSFKYKVPAN